MKSRKEQVLDAAARLFRKMGYKASSLRLIASEMDMEAASLYNHISSKQEILRELLFTVAEQFAKGMEEIKNSTLDPYAKLERLVGLHVRLTIDNTNAMALITGDWIHLEEPALGQYSAMRNAYEKDFRNILEAAMKDGSIQAVNIDIALYSILSSLHWLYSWYNKHKDFNPVELEKQMITCLLEGLGARSQGRGDTRG